MLNDPKQRLYEQGQGYILNIQEKEHNLIHGYSYSRSLSYKIHSHKLEYTMYFSPV